MKKSLMFVMLGIVSFLGINSVSANTYEASNYYLYFDEHIQAYENYKDNINHLIDYWENNHSSEYPFYFIIGSKTYRLSSNEKYWEYTLYSSNSTDFILQQGALIGLGDPFDGNEHVYSYQYNSDTNEYIYSGVMRSFQYWINYKNDVSSYIIDSNVSPTFKQQIYQYSQNGTLHTEDFNSIHLPTFISNVTSLIIPEINITDKGVIPTLKSLYNGTYTPNLADNYTEIDLNDYPYIVLSLKDYTERNTFTSNMYVKGQVCATTLYNYGLEEKKDYVSGYQTPPCSYYYNDFTPFTSYVKSDDIKNHAVYYLTTYDKTKPNVVKVDNSIYDITYITSENENEPYVSISGKNYPTLPYSSLTDSATLTEKNGISNEWTCAKYDTDCLANSSNMNINDLFDKPLEFLKELWSSITSIFEVITEFISLLPPTMQSFLYLSFMVAIVLGLLKLIL